MEWRLAAARHALQQGRPRMCLSLLSPLGHTLTSTTAAHAPVPAPGPQPGSQKPSPKLDPSMPGGAEGRGPSCATGGPGAGVPDGVAASEKRQLAQLTALARIQLATTRKDWRQVRPPLQGLVFSLRPMRRCLRGCITQAFVWRTASQGLAWDMSMHNPNLGSCIWAGLQAAYAARDALCLSLLGVGVA